ncbi:MAG: HDIG domain-containing protein [Firmicutes bacterium]|nr:HDIG domain-containing protein [Bacillota bacterium]
MNSQIALDLLNNSKGLAEDDNWIIHSICVGNTATVIAKALHLDEDKAKTLGYIHDIGKRFGFGASHGLAGYEYILSLGYNEEYANVCLTHSYLNNDINCIAGGIPNPGSPKYEWKKEFIKKSQVYNI